MTYRKKFQALYALATLDYLYVRFFNAIAHAKRIYSFICSFEHIMVIASVLNYLDRMRHLNNRSVNFNSSNIQESDLIFRIKPILRIHSNTD